MKEIEAAKAVLDQHFVPKEAKVFDGSDVTPIDPEATDALVSEYAATPGNDLVNVPNVLNWKNYMFLKPFSFEGRIRRTEYCLSFIIQQILSYLFSESDLGPEYILFMIPIWWFALAQGVKRCHDRGNSGWYTLIPFYILWMFFGDREDGINEYGPNPKGIGN